MTETDNQLADMLTDERLEKIDAVLDSRLKGLTVVLEDLHKPQNMGACIRTLEAAGIQDVHYIATETAFVPNPKITQGCHKWVDTHPHHTPEAAVSALKDAGFRILATSPYAKQTLDSLTFDIPTALCFGNELDGLSERLLALADDSFQIPITGFTRSYNISVALGMCVHVASQSRRRSLNAAGDLTADQKAALRSRWLRLGRKGSDLIVPALNGRTPQV